MRRLLMLIPLVALLAACGGNADPTPTATFTAAPETTQDLAAFTPAQPFSELATTAAENAVLITPPVAGTLNRADNTQMPIDFNIVSFSRSGGITGERLTVIAQSDGTLMVNDETRQISDIDLQRIQTALETLQIYDIQGVFTAPGGSADIYYYTIGVNSSRGAISIEAQDGYVPPELQAVFDLMLQLAEPLPTP